MRAVVSLLLLSLAACGGGSRAPKGPAAPTLQPSVQSLTYYQSRADCAQGPFELELPITEAKYGQQLELLVRTPRLIQLHVQVVAGDAELATTDGAFGPTGRTTGRPDNARCVADARERLAASRGAGTSGGGAGGGGMPPVVGEPGAGGGATIRVELERIPAVVGAFPVVTLNIPDTAVAVGRVRIRLWSIEPNDLVGVAFGITHVVQRPNVSEAEYDAYLVRPPPVTEPPRPSPSRPPPPARESPTYVVDDTARAEAAARREAKARADAEAAAERARRREQFCAAHPGDHGCWGPGGLRVHLELEARRRDRETYCAAHPIDDARCWSAELREKIRADEQARVVAATTVSKPSGPPPAPIAETQPPKLSANAEWRPGYWQWIESTWVWLAGSWRVPEADIVAEQTTTAPVAPPPVQAETPPPPPVTVAVWVPGFWQWDGATWIWIAGNYQLRPSAASTWRPTTWRARGSVHILVPGGWVRR